MMEEEFKVQPGFRFYPTEEELVSFYLSNKVDGRRKDVVRAMDIIIPAVDIYEFDPSDLPQKSAELSKVQDSEQWFFFLPMREQESRGGRPRRMTTNGYWKATGSPANIYSDNHVIGRKRTMVFYRGRIPYGKKTEWKMNEYHIAAQVEKASASPRSIQNKLQVRKEFSLCRVYTKSKFQRSFDRRPRKEVGKEKISQLVAGSIQPVSSDKIMEVEESYPCLISDTEGYECSNMFVHCWDDDFKDWEALSCWLKDMEAN